MKASLETIQTWTERRIARERAARGEIKSVSIDAAVKCICPHCSQVHFIRKESSSGKETK